MHVSLKFFFSLILFPLYCLGQSDALGMGCVCMDILLKVEDSFLEQMVPEASKGIGFKGDLQRINQILKTSQNAPAYIPGGSAANTIRGLAKLGVTCSFFSHIGNDTYGKELLADLKSLNISPLLSESHLSSDLCLCLITPDGQRTMCGIEAPYQEAFASPSVFQGVKLFHFECRRLMKDPDLVFELLEYAKSQGCLISCGLSGKDVIDKHRTTIFSLIKKYVSIVFCNDLEISALTDLPPKEACYELQKICLVAAVTLGEKGCVLGSQGKLIEIPAFDAKVIDTTGAGDLFASGFLFAYLKGLPLEMCGKMGNRLGASIVEVVGARLPDEAWEPVFTFLSEFIFE